MRLQLEFSITNAGVQALAAQAQNNPVLGRLKAGHQQCARRARCRKAFSLLEITIGTLMAAGIAVMAASVTVDLTRNMADNVASTRIASESRLAIESLRRDFGGNDPDRPDGDRSQWRLVGVQVPSADELHLCFDADVNRTADWASPDRVVVYDVQDNQLIRSDAENSRATVISHLVESFECEIIGTEIRMTVTFELGRVEESFVFNTPMI